MGYDTRLSDAASNVSGGQRQRIALARALVHRPGMLVLDEATSALDGSTERAIIDDLRRENFTVVVVTHRLDTIEHADLVLVVDGGRIVERRSRADAATG